MNMIGGSTFTGNSGVTYTSGLPQNVGNGDVRLALMNGWSPSGTIYIPNSYALAYPGITNVQKVMASPPTVAISTTNPAATGQEYNVCSGTATPSLDLSNFSITGAGNAVQSGTANPDWSFAAFNSVTANNNPAIQSGSNLVRVSVIFNSAQAAPLIAFRVKGLTGNITAKVNDQYVSLTPTAIPNNGVSNYYSLTFAAAGTYRIDVIADNVLSNFRFAGCWTGNKTDTVQPATIRGGKRILVMGDSITSATGAPNQSAGYVQCFAEYMGYDDVWPSGVGGVGILNAGASSTYQNHVQQDVIAFNPDEVIIAGFYNDNGFTGAPFYTALQQLVLTIQSSLPGCKIYIFGPYAPYGAGYQIGAATAAGFVAQRVMAAQLVAAMNSPLVRLLDPNTLPFYSSSNIAEAPLTYSITASAAAGATTLSTSANLNAGAQYQFADGSRFRVLSISGLTATIDKNPNAQASGATFVQCGTCWISGNGKSGATTGVGNADNYISSDGIHPNALGHLNLGITLGRLYIAAQSSEG